MIIYIQLLLCTSDMWFFFFRCLCSRWCFKSNKGNILSIWNCFTFTVYDLDITKIEVFSFCTCTYLVKTIWIMCFCCCWCLFIHQFFRVVVCYLLEFFGLLFYLIVWWVLLIIDKTQLYNDPHSVAISRTYQINFAYVNKISSWSNYFQWWFGAGQPVKPRHFLYLSVPSHVSVIQLCLVLLYIVSFFRIIFCI